MYDDPRCYMAAFGLSDSRLLLPLRWVLLFRRCGTHSSNRLSPRFSHL